MSVGIIVAVTLIRSPFTTSLQNTFLVINLDAVVVAVAYIEETALRAVDSNTLEPKLKPKKKEGGG